MIEQNMNVFSFAFDKSQITFMTKITLELVINLICDIVHIVIVPLLNQHNNINCSMFQLKMHRIFNIFNVKIVITSINLPNDNKGTL